MASAIASGFPLASPSLQLPKSQNRQVSAKGVHGPVNCLVQKPNLGDPFPKTSIQRRAKAASTSDKIYKLKVVAGADSNADLEGGDSEKESSLTQKQSELKRRELLWAATGTFSYLSSPGLVQSAPVPASDLRLRHCSPVELVTPGFSQTCCLPDPEALGLKPIRFEFDYNLPMRTRKPAHILSNDPEYVSKYNEAYRKMKALPDNDPRSFLNQWYVHCAFCNGAYLEPNRIIPLPLQYHFSWTFLPWHRMYLYFHERILGELIDDPSFALPFWNWDNQRRGEGGNQMPGMFADDLGSKNDELRNAIRNPAHFPPAYVNLGGINTGNLKDTLRGNLSVVHRGVMLPTAAALFLGGKYQAHQEEATNSPGSCETQGHNAMHEWTGSHKDPRYPDSQDMGVFIYAGRDPIFFSHHANIDRLWTVWKTLPKGKSTRRGRRRRHESRRPAFLNTEFAFYDQNKQLVHCTIKDSMDITNLRYQYETMPSDSDWINFEGKLSGATKPSQSDIEAYARTPPVLAHDGSRTFLLTRRNPSDAEIQAHDDEQLTPEELEETLLVKGVQVPKRGYMAFSVFINMPDASQETPLDVFEFTGLITHLAHGGKHHHSTSGINFRLSIGTAMNELNLPVGESVSVTFVPHVNQEEDVPFDGVESEWR